MAAAPNHSIPDQHGRWADVKAAYRFLNHDGVSPEEIQRTHREQVRAACSSHSRILAIQDTTHLDFTSRSNVEGLGPLTQGHQGLFQHSTLAGGGIQGGQIVGETDELGYHITKDPIHVHDLQATILHCLGFDHERLTYAFQGRDFRLTDVAGNVVGKLLA